MNHKNQNITSTWTENFEFEIEQDRLYSVQVSEVYPKN